MSDIKIMATPSTRERCEFLIAGINHFLSCTVQLNDEIESLDEELAKLEDYLYHQAEDFDIGKLTEAEQDCGDTICMAEKLKVEIDELRDDYLRLDYYYYRAGLRNLPSDLEKKQLKEAAKNLEEGTILLDSLISKLKQAGDALNYRMQDYCH